MSTTNQLQEQFDVFLKDNEKFEDGNSAAGTRARKALGDLAKLAKTRRAEITETKNQRKTEKEAVASKEIKKVVKKK